MRQLKRIPFTKEGYENLKKEYEDLLAKRPAAVATLKQARELGDLSENGLYKAARANLSSIDANLRRLDRMIKLATVTETASTGNVELGSHVLVQDEQKTKEFIIVGAYEADPLKGKISTNSPIGSSLMGKTIGDSIKITTPKGQVVYKILKIK